MDALEVTEKSADDLVREEVFAILDGWAETLAINYGPWWTLAGTGPDGVRRAGSNPDPIALAHKLFAQGLAPEPEPVAVESATTDDVVPTLDDASDEPFAPAEEEDGSFIEEEGEPAASEIFDLSDLLDAHQPGGVGVMVNNTGGVMASDRTEELRSQRMGEVVRAFNVRIDARWTTEKAKRLNDLRSQAQAAKTNDALPLNDDETTDLDALYADERWAQAMTLEQQSRLDMLDKADAETLQSYVAREGWPT